MNPLAISLILISAIIHIYWNFILKKSINKGADPVLVLWLSSILSVIIYSLAFLLFAWSLPITLYGIFLSALCGVFIAVYIFTLSKSYSYGDLSHVYPLAKITPLFTLLIGILFLGELVAPFALIGIILVIIGAYSIHLEGFRIRHILKPVVSLKHNASILALFTAILSAFYGLFSKLGTAEINPFAFVYLTFFFAMVFYTPFLHFRTQTISSQFRKFRGAIIKIGLLDLLAYTMVVSALFLSRLSYVFALREIDILFSVIIGSLVLKESHGRARLVAAIIIFAGIILISVF